MVRLVRGGYRNMSHDSDWHMLLADLFDELDAEETKT